MAINERRAAAGDDVIAFSLIVMRNGARNRIRRRTCHLLTARDGLGRGLALPGRWRGRRVPRGGTMNDPQLHAPAIADIDHFGILVTDPLGLFGGADPVDLSLGDDGSGVGFPGRGWAWAATGMRTDTVSKTLRAGLFISFLLN